MTTIVHSIGTLIGTIFLAVMLLQPGNKNTGKVRYRLKSRYKGGLIAVYLFFVAGSLAAFVLGPVEMTPQRSVEVSFWVSLMFMMIYLQADDLLITDTGIAFRDLFGKVRGRYYPWSKVVEGKVATNRVSFMIEGDRKPKRVGISVKTLDEATLRDIEKMVKKATGTYAKRKDRS